MRRRVRRRFRLFMIKIAGLALHLKNRWLVHRRRLAKCSLCCREQRQSIFVQHATASVRRPQWASRFESLSIKGNYCVFMHEHVAFMTRARFCFCFVTTHGYFRNKTNNTFEVASDGAILHNRSLLILFLVATSRPFNNGFFSYGIIPFNFFIFCAPPAEQNGTRDRVRDSFVLQKRHSN